MQLRFSAHYIFPIELPPLKYGIVETDSQGKILNIIDTKGQLAESHSLAFYEGIIVPSLPEITAFEEIPFPEHFSEMQTMHIQNLKVLDILKEIQNNYPNASLGLMLNWATAFLFENLVHDYEKGRITIGNKPGLNLITHIDFVKMKLTSQSEVKVLI